MKIIKDIFIWIFIGKKNEKYINSFSFITLGIVILISFTGDYFRGYIENMEDFLHFLLVYIIVILLFSRFFIFIYEGVQKFWIKVFEKKNIN